MAHKPAPSLGSATPGCSLSSVKATGAPGALLRDTRAVQLTTHLRIRCTNRFTAFASLVCVGALSSHAALAHVTAGPRIFPGTLTFDDPGAADEASADFHLHPQRVRLALSANLAAPAPSTPAPT